MRPRRMPPSAARHHAWRLRRTPSATSGHSFRRLRVDRSVWPLRLACDHWRRCGTQPWCPRSRRAVRGQPVPQPAYQAHTMPARWCILRRHQRARSTRQGPRSPIQMGSRRPWSRCASSGGCWGMKRQRTDASTMPLPLLLIQRPTGDMRRTGVRRPGRRARVPHLAAGQRQGAAISAVRCTTASERIECGMHVLLRCATVQGHHCCRMRRLALPRRCWDLAGRRRRRQRQRRLLRRPPRRRWWARWWCRACR